MAAGAAVEVVLVAAGVTAKEADCIKSRFIPARLGTGGLGPQTGFLGGGFISAIFGSPSRTSLSAASFPASPALLPALSGGGNRGSELFEEKLDFGELSKLEVVSAS